MNKPDWAEEWNEAEFDYGFEKAYAATVGPFSNAVRVHKRRLVQAPTYKYEKVKDEFWCDDCGEYHEYHHFAKTIDKPGIYEDVSPMTEEEVHASLEDWFKARAMHCRQFLKLAEERGW